jgi:hypothetical protein
LAPLEIVSEEEEEEKDVEKEVHPIINKMVSQPAFSSPNSKATITTTTKMMREVNEHHDSGFIENDTHKQQDDGDDSHAER